jgi:hypothetical protein
MPYDKETPVFKEMDIPLKILGTNVALTQSSAISITFEGPYATAFLKQMKVPIHACSRDTPVFAETSAAIPSILSWIA